MPQTIKKLVSSEASGGVLLMMVAVLAILTANSPLADGYFHSLHIYIGPLSLLHWINDALMAVFFLMVGLEIKREMLIGELSSWKRRVLPGFAALGGMVFPALFYVGFNWSQPSALRGWAIPTATDIAFALGVLSLFGSRIPSSLKIFLAALAIIDDLGAVIVIALFYTAELNMPALGGVAIVLGALCWLNWTGTRSLWPYIGLGFVLWILVFASGIHATLAGVLLALTIPLRERPSETRNDAPLLRLEHMLHKPVAFVVVPIFGFANAGVSFSGATLATFTAPLTLGVASGLLLGKLIGVFGTVAAMVKLRLAELPSGANWRQMGGVACLCGIGFTMSLFIGLLAFDDPAIQDHVKMGILLGSLLSGTCGAAILLLPRSAQGRL